MNQWGADCRVTSNILVMSIPSRSGNYIPVLYNAKPLHCFIGGSSQAGTPTDVNTSSSAVTPLAQATVQFQTDAGISQTLSMLIYCKVECDSNSDHSALPAAINILFEVMMFLKKFHGWMDLGLALGLLYPTLEKIKKDNDKTDDCKREMLVAWLQQQDEVSKKGVPSWSVMRAALKMIGENELADKISFDGQL